MSTSVGVFVLIFAIECCFCVTLSFYIYDLTTFSVSKIVSFRWLICNSDRQNELTLPTKQSIKEHNLMGLAVK